MQLRMIRTIFGKEILDTLRDRRTLVFMLAVPLIAIPLLMTLLSGLVLGQIEKVSEERSKVVIEGRSYLPAELETLLTESEDISVSFAEEHEGKDLEDELKIGTFDILMVIPEAFDRAIDAESTTDIEIFYDKAEVSSEFALGKVNRILREYRESVIEARLVGRDISGEIIKPFEVSEYNVASMKKVAGEKFGAMLPYMIIIMCFMGAMYPAIDLAAGEKERGTLETLLVSPATRGEFVIGKYLVILTTAVIAAILSMVSLTFSLNYLMGEMAEALSEMLAIQFDLTAVILVLMIVLPMAGVFAAILLSVSIFARSFKEAQSYITVLNMLVILPAFVSMLPGVDMDYSLALIPVVNVSLIIKDAISGTVEWNYVITAFISTNVLAAVTLFCAKKWFERESVLFRM